MKRLFSLLLLSFCLVGCSTHQADISVISNKNIELGKVDLDKSEQKLDVLGEDRKFVFLFIPFGTPQLKEALNDAFRKTNGDLMIDASVYTNFWWFIVGEQAIQIRGTVVKTRDREIGKSLDVSSTQSNLQK